MGRWVKGRERFDFASGDASGFSEDIAGFIFGNRSVEVVDDVGLIYVWRGSVVCGSSFVDCKESEN